MKDDDQQQHNKEGTARARKRTVILDRPGVIACGDYQAGKEYEVDAEVARRLVSVKGFRYTTTNQED